jgi:hypothetical protein
MTDFTVENHGSIYLLRPRTDEGQAWIDDNLVVEDYQRLGNSVAVEHRYIGNIVTGIVADGLSVS